MKLEPLRPGDKRLVVLVLLLIAVSAAFTLHNYSAAFPQASIDLQYSRSEITAMAEKFLADHGFSTTGYRNLTLFDPDDDARLYLEKELGLEEANRLMQHEVSVWRWRARWFKPPEKEELIVRLSPDGRLVGFQHVVAEETPGARLQKEAALEKATRFLRQQTSLPQRLIEDRLRDRPNRNDYVFTWEQEGFHAKDATYRRTIVIVGDQVGEYSEYLHVPEQWERDYATLRSSNDLYFGLAEALYVVLILAAIAVLILSLRQHKIRWRPLLFLAGSVAVLQVINQWNLLPFFIDAMPTSSTYRNTLLLGLLEGIGAGAGYFFYVIGGAAPGQPLYKELLPARLSLTAAFSGRGIRTREFFRAVVAGYGFAAVHLVYVVAFYLIGKRFGVWSPQDVSYSNLLSTAVPWLYPLTIAMLAAASEEFWFRLLAVPLFKRYFRFTWIAVVIPAFLWGFLHSNYPQEPGFIRGIEIGIIGIFAGILMLRFGIIATLTWHYTIDALLFSTILFSSGSWYLWASGIAVTGAALIPLGICLYHYRRNGGFLADPGMRNDADQEPAAASPASGEPQRLPREPIRPKWRLRWLLVVALVGVIAGLSLKPLRFGDFIKVRLSASDAVSIAERSLASKSKEAILWRHTVSFHANLDEDEFEYIRRIEGARTANEIVRDHTFHGIWVVRFFRPMQQEEWRVFVNQRGIAYRTDHVIDEKAPGARLSIAEAKQRAERFLAGQGASVEMLRLVESSEEKRDKRTDHAFVWEKTDFRVGEATARFSLSLIGDEICYYRRFLKLPEQWLRDFHRPRLEDYLAPALAGAFGLPLLIVFLRRLSSRSHPYYWRASLGAGAVTALLMAASSGNHWRAALAGYDTAKPWENFLAQWALSHLIVILLAGVGAFLVFLATDVFLQEAVGFRALPEPSVPRTLGVAAALWGVFRVLEFAGQLIPGDRFSLPLWSLPGADSYLPGFAAVSHGIFFLIVGFLPAVIAVAAAWRYLRNRTGCGILAATVALVALSRSANFWQWSFHVVELVVLAGVLILLIRTCGVDLAGFAVAVFWLQAGAGSVALIEQPAAMLKWNGIVALLVTVIAGLLVLLRWKPRASFPGGNQSPVAGDVGTEDGPGSVSV